MLYVPIKSIADLESIIPGDNIVDNNHVSYPIKKIKYRGRHKDYYLVELEVVPFEHEPIPAYIFYAPGNQLYMHIENKNIYPIYRQPIGFPKRDKLEWTYYSGDKSLQTGNYLFFWVPQIPLAESIYQSYTSYYGRLIEKVAPDTFKIKLAQPEPNLYYLSIRPEGIKYQLYFGQTLSTLKPLNTGEIWLNSS